MRSTSRLSSPRTLIIIGLACFINIFSSQVESKNTQYMTDGQIASAIKLLTEFKKRFSASWNTLPTMGHYVDIPIPDKYSSFKEENLSIFDGNISVLKSGKRIPLKKYHDYQSAFCEIGNYTQPFIYLNLIIYHETDLSVLKARERQPLTMLFANTKGCRSHPIEVSFENREITISEAKAGLQQSLDTRLPRIRLDPQIRFVQLVEGSYTEIDELPYEEEIFVELVFEDEDPPSEARLIKIDIGNHEIELTAHAIEKRLFRSDTAFEILSDDEEEVSP